ncbi:hypothetical protein [Acidovorax sp. ACV01]|uniref:hypothetical protein n=1 Tax=Acidovorax sp. ACV01 TaxID=2769311 RepID=UPI00177B3A05|nr:hypothetical protein [Acidovorax sp. ACV01]MBD9395131.1 hypothetical protein [Acidovorax sp. ACV01]
MTTYQLTHEGYVIKDGDTKVPTNTMDGVDPHPETVAYYAWRVLGNIPLPADPPTPEVALALIAELEQASGSPQRIVREGLILMVESQAAAAGVPLTYVRAKNKGYRLLKECEEQIAALRQYLIT